MTMVAARPAWQSRLSGLLPSWARTVRMRLALTYSTVLFGLSALILGGIYVAVAATIPNEPLDSFTVSKFWWKPNGEIAYKPGEEFQAADLAAVQNAVNYTALTTLRDYSLIALACMFALSLLIGWWVAGRALKPIATITGITQDITATDLSRRIGASGPTDEMRTLADTIDGMLGRLDRAFAGERRLIEDVSHELRNPVTVVQANVEAVLADTDASPAQRSQAAAAVLGATIAWLGCWTTCWPPPEPDPTRSPTPTWTWRRWPRPVRRSIGRWLNAAGCGWRNGSLPDRLPMAIGTRWPGPPRTCCRTRSASPQSAARSLSAWVASRAGPGSRSPTRVRACPKRPAARSSTGSIAAPTPKAVAPVWGWRSADRSPRVTTDSCGSPAMAKAVPSRCGYPTGRWIGPPNAPKARPNWTPWPANPSRSADHRRTGVRPTGPDQPAEWRSATAASSASVKSLTTWRSRRAL